MNTVKPILVVGLPEDAPKEAIDLVGEKISSTIDEEYHVLVYISKKIDFSFQVFYEKDFDEVKYEELKQIVKDKINNL